MGFGFQDIVSIRRGLVPKSLTNFDCLIMVMGTNPSFGANFLILLCTPTDCFVQDLDTTSIEIILIIVSGGRTLGFGTIFVQGLNGLQDSVVQGTRCVASLDFSMAVSALVM